MELTPKLSCLLLCFTTRSLHPFIVQVQFCFPSSFLCLLFCCFSWLCFLFSPALAGCNHRPIIHIMLEWLHKTLPPTPYVSCPRWGPRMEWAKRTGWDHHDFKFWGSKKNVKSSLLSVSYKEKSLQQQGWNSSSSLCTLCKEMMLQQYLYLQNYQVQLVYKLGSFFPTYIFVFLPNFTFHSGRRHG